MGDYHSEREQNDKRSHQKVIWLKGPPKKFLKNYKKYYVKYGFLLTKMTLSFKLVSKNLKKT